MYKLIKWINYENCAHPFFEVCAIVVINRLSYEKVCKLNQIKLYISMNEILKKKCKFEN